MAESVINPRMLTVPMVAKYLSATNWFVEELVRNKQLPAQKYGKSWVVDLQDINTWIEQRKAAHELNEMMANIRPMTIEEAKHFFDGVPRDKDGCILGSSPDDPWNGLHTDDCQCVLCKE
jgi:excisionase family DNA binding protein